MSYVIYDPEVCSRGVHQAIPAQNANSTRHSRGGSQCPRVAEEMHTRSRGLFAFCASSCIGSSNGRFVRGLRIARAEDPDCHVPPHPPLSCSRSAPGPARIHRPSPPPPAPPAPPPAAGPTRNIGLPEGFVQMEVYEAAGPWGGGGRCPTFFRMPAVIAS